MDKLCIHRVSVAILLLLVSLLATSSGEIVNITDGETLKGYLCSPSGTIPPNTTLFIMSNMVMTNQEQFCLVENTSDITIAGFLHSGYDYFEVFCQPNFGIGFFNVTNLTIASMSFRNCDDNSFPPSAIRYINNTEQFLYYNNETRIGLILNHCSNVKIHNYVSFEVTILGILGVNLCGYNNITIVVPFYPSMSVLFYYVDSDLTSSSDECYLRIESNAFSSLPLMVPFEEHLSGKPNRIPVSVTRGFALMITQQRFNAIVDIRIVPIAVFGFSFSISGLIFFVNSITDSRVTLQGLYSNYCIDEHFTSDYRSLTLSVMFYEIPLFDTSVNRTIESLIIRNTSFVLYLKQDRIQDFGFSAALRIIKITEKISHQIVLSNVSWCTRHTQDSSNDEYKYKIKSILPYLLHIQTLSKDESCNNADLHVDMINVNMHRGTSYGSDIAPQSTQNFIKFIYVQNITMSGSNYFAIGDGGSVIDVISSNLTLTGDLTISNGYAFQGGGIRLDGSSTLFLKEPLRAQFINNTGSAIYAPIHTYFAHVNSSIQVMPNQVYSLTNISDINITLYFEDNLNINLNASVSMYVPLLNFLYHQTSSNLLFTNNTWDDNHMQYAYTTMFDAIFETVNELDKFTSFSNGICTRIRQLPWNCTYIDNIYRELPKLYEYINPIDPGKILPTVHAYPGENVFSVFHQSEEFSIINCSNYERVRDRYYSITRGNPTILFTFRNEERGNYCFLIVISNTEVPELTVPLVKVIVNATCPPGFYLTDEGYCDCISALQDHNYTCNISSRIFTSPEGFWTGYEEHNTNNTISYTISFSSHCPPNYCNQSFQNFLVDNSIADLSCLNNRTGVLCGQCKENYSAIFGSDACFDDCTDVYLLTLLAYALAGLLLVAVLFALKLTVAVGTINGVIFYANILGLSMDKLTEGHHGPHLIFFRIVISLLNLDLGFPLCFYKGMTTTDKVGLQFVFPMYIWGIVIGMIIVAKYSLRVANHISKYAVQVLATLFHLSFPKLLRTVIDIITHSTIDLVVFDPDHMNREQTVWFYSGEEYGKGMHGFYLFLASVFILFLLLYTILTTFSSCFMRFKLVNKFKPLIDAYGGPFKDKWRFWFGLRLWVTVLIFSVSGALQGTDSNRLFIFNLVILLIFVQIQSFARPFKSCLILIMDLFFMINYWLIILFYLVFKSNFIEAYIFLLSAAILVLVLVLFSHFCYLYIYSKNPGVFLQVKTKFHRRFKGYERIEDRVNEEADMEIFKAAKEREQEQVFDTY